MEITKKLVAKIIVEAIEKLPVKDTEYAASYSVVIYGNSCYIEVNGYVSYTLINEITASTKQEAVVLAVSAFLEWFELK